MTLNFEAPGFTVRGVLDQDDRLYYEITSGEKVGLVLATRVASAGNPAAVIAEQLGDQGILLLTSSTRASVLRALENCSPSSEHIKVADYPGWLTDGSFVFHDGTAFTEAEENPAVNVLFQPSSKWGRAGSHNDWR